MAKARPRNMRPALCARRTACAPAPPAAPMHRRHACAATDGGWGAGRRCARDRRRARAEGRGRSRPGLGRQKWICAALRQEAGKTAHMRVGRGRSAVGRRTSEGRARRGPRQGNGEPSGRAQHTLCSACWNTKKNTSPPPGRRACTRTVVGGGLERARAPPRPQWEWRTTSRWGEKRRSATRPDP